MPLDNSLQEKNTLENSKVKQNIFKRLFATLFGFETNLDLTDQIAVLKRKNQVIKNIIFLLNFSFFTMMLIYSSLTQFIVDQDTQFVHKITNWIFLAATFPTTFILNYFLKKLIKKQNPGDNEYNLTRQQTAQYIIIFYLFIAPLLFYLKINFNWENNGLPEVYRNTFETFSYLMFYLSLISVSFYQDRKVMINASLIMFAILSLVHFLLTHNFINLIKQIKTREGNVIYAAAADIILRYIVFILFVITIYAITNMSNRLQQERRNELIKRINVEGDFTLISNTIFSSVKIFPQNYFNNQEAKDIQTISLKLASFVGLSIDLKRELEDMCVVQLRKDELLVESSNNYNETIKTRAHLGTLIIRRVQITQVIEQSLRNYLEKNILGSVKLEKELLEEIIFISELYYRLRSPQEFKEPYTHEKTIILIKEIFYPLMKYEIMSCFIEYEEDFKELYLNL